MKTIIINSITSVIIIICPVIIIYLFIMEDTRKYRREDKTRKKT